MKKKKFALCIGIIFSMFFLFAGCMEDEKNVEIFMPESLAKLENNSNAPVVIDVYWDATYSMRGYTTLAAGNVYRMLPDILGDIGGSMGEIKFFRFGAQIQPLEGREYRNFSKPETYTELITAAYNAIDAADPNHLSIIVTDLFESYSDWSNVTNSLRNKYFSKHLSVAVIGVKNSFMGDIFDVGLNAAKFHYSSNDNPKKFRPFYLFLMGDENQIRNFIEQWKSKQNNSNEMQYLIFSENLTEQAGDFSKLTVKDFQNFFEDEKLAIKDKRMKEFGIANFDDPAKLSVSFNYQPIFGICPFDIETLKTSAKVFELVENEEGFSWKPSESENDIEVEFYPSHEQENFYDVNITFTPQNTLIKDSLNFVNVSLAPTPKSYSLPDWVKQWNMDDDADIAASNFDGSKTINLLRIMESLKDSVLAASNPSLVEVNLVIDER